MKSDYFERIQKLEKTRDLKKNINKIIRNKKFTEDEKKEKIKEVSNFSYKTIDIILNPKETYIKSGFPSYDITSDTNEIKRLKERLETEKIKTTKKTSEFKFNDFTLEFNIEDNRIRFHYDFKPDETIRNNLKKHGYKWSKTQSAWQTELTENAYYSLNHLLSKLLNKDEINQDLQDFLNKYKFKDWFT